MGMIILGIETSCDETAAAIIEDGTSILSNVVASSMEKHSQTGGIIPEVAAREQVKCMIPVLEEAIKQPSNITIKMIDAIAVTIGPGLIGSLLVGIETAKTLAFVWNKPIIPVNHLVAHLYANWLTDNQQQTTDNKVPEFPAIALVVSGGHTDLVFIKSHQEIEWIGGTRDDAAGECFDKSARLLGLGYPGGPAIAAAAEKFPALPAGRQIPNSKFQIKLPRPMLHEDNFDFSFSGLKTAVLKEVRRLNLEANSHLPPQNPASQFPPLISALAYELQEAITDVLVVKTIKAAEKYQVKSILLGGGVTANQKLREKMQLEIRNSKLEINLFIPPSKLCTDNAAYIASRAYFNYRPVPWSKIIAEPGLTITETAGAL